jgi:signal transduction histidine kinase/CheY-like chemotaxis protein
MTAAATPEADLAERVARLERRLMREHAARVEAEAIAEAETAALYDQTRRLTLLETIATESNLSRSVEAVMMRTLELICGFTTWPLGHVYLRVMETAERPLRSAQLWYAKAGLDVEAFREASESAAFGPGEGLPGRVVETGSSLWLPDIREDANFPRAAMARACGLRAAFAFPVLVGDQVVAVLEFFVDRERSPDEALLRILDRVGAILGRVIERDAAERLSRETHVELERMVAEAQAASAAKTRFLAVTSHEVRTPLNAVLGLAEALSRGAVSEEQRALVDGIRDSGAMLLRLLNSVLDIARIETGRVALVAAPFDLASVAETVGRIWVSNAGQAEVAIALDLSGLARPCRIVSDAGKIEQTLVNLVSNAVKFTPPGGRVLIRLASADAGARRRILAEVLDDGPGVAEADRARIFEAYEQTAEGRSAGGAGLGLAICAGNVGALGGRIGVDGRDGGGSRFHFEIEADIAEPECEAAPEPRASTEASDRPPLRILAAEDNLANQQVLRLLLQPAGLEPVFVENGLEAVTAAQSEPFDLILMDANMPQMDGIAALRQIRALPGPAARVPIHMVTANVFDEDRARYREAGADGVLAKPIVVSELYALLTSIAGPEPAEVEAA